MKYSSNAAQELTALGFTLDYHNENPEEGTNYEVWYKGKLDITVDHQRQKLCLNIQDGWCDTENFKATDIEVLDRLFNAEKEEGNHPEEKYSKGPCSELTEKHQEKLSEIFDMIHDPRCKQSVHYNSLIGQLHALLATLQNETTPIQDTPAIASTDVEMDLTRHILKCLKGDGLQISSILPVLKHLHDYKVLADLPHQKKSISPQKVHLILQDNFPNSSLTNFMNILFSGDENTVCKSITL